MFPLTVSLDHDDEDKAFHLRTARVNLDTKAMIAHSRQHIKRRDIANVKKERGAGCTGKDNEDASAANDDDRRACLFCI